MGQTVGHLDTFSTDFQMFKYDGLRLCFEIAQKW